MTLVTVFLTSLWSEVYGVNFGGICFVLLRGFVAIPTQGLNDEVTFSSIVMVWLSG